MFPGCSRPVNRDARITARWVPSHTSAPPAVTRPAAHHSGEPNPLPASVTKVQPAAAVTAIDREVHRRRISTTSSQWSSVTLRSAMVGSMRPPAMKVYILH